MAEKKQSGVASYARKQEEDDGTGSPRTQAGLAMRTRRAVRAGCNPKQLKWDRPMTLRAEHGGGPPYGVAAWLGSPFTSATIPQQAENGSSSPLISLPPCFSASFASPSSSRLPRRAFR